MRYKITWLDGNSTFVDAEHQLDAVLKVSEGKTVKPYLEVEESPKPVFSTYSFILHLSEDDYSEVYYYGSLTGCRICVKEFIDSWLEKRSVDLANFCDYGRSVAENLLEDLK